MPPNRASASGDSAGLHENDAARDVARDIEEMLGQLGRRSPTTKNLAPSADPLY